MQFKAPVSSKLCFNVSSVLFKGRRNDFFFFCKGRVVPGRVFYSDQSSLHLSRKNLTNLDKTLVLILSLRLLGKRFYNCLVTLLLGLRNYIFDVCSLL